MAFKINSPYLKKLVLSLAGSPLLKNLEKSSRNIKLAQSQVLSEILNSSKDTLFGKEHGFKSIKSAQDFSKAVPVRDFEGFRGYIERMCRGE